jgi:3-oxoacyl-[acyl-carrier protein] reductase
VSGSPIRVALITGASRGIGAAAAIAFARHGYRVVVNFHRRADAAATVVTKIERLGSQAVPVRADVSDPDQARDLVQTTVQTYGRVDTLVCNASTPIHPAPFEALCWEVFARKMLDELAAAYHVTQAALPIMQDQRYGRLVYVSSNHSDGPAAPGMIAHGSAKAALNTFARYLAHEQGPHGITANVVSPGYVHTESSATIITAATETGIARRTPLRRVADPADIGRIIALIGSDDAAFTTGVTIPVNGGLGLAL